jgi:hypothetical protein
MWCRGISVPDAGARIGRPFVLGYHRYGIKKGGLAMTARSPLVQTKREMAGVQRALTESGSGAVPTLECRLADLQGRFLSTPATSLGDVVARLEAVREIVVSLGEPGYLLHLVDATLNDVRALAVRVPVE